MSMLKSLLNTYNECLEEGLVDKHFGDDTVLLPLFHTNLRSIGSNVIDVSLTKDGKFVGAEYILENKRIIFPVTMDSVARTSAPCAHPLVDQIVYLLPGNEKKHLSYKETFSKFYNWVENEKQKEFLNIIDTFLKNESAYDLILKSLYGDIPLEKISLFEIQYEDDKGKTKKVDLEKIYLTFTVVDFDNGLDISVTNNIELHNEYINYIKSQYKGKNELCNISGKEDYIVEKHRGLLGGAKIISVSNKKETYYGRFKKGDDIISVGYETSEKIHLMLKYFLENENNRVLIGSDQYLVNWFSDDISNENDIDITADMSEQSFFTSIEDQNKKLAVGEDNKVGRAACTGNDEINYRDDKDNEDYYVMIVDKSSNGRISVKYYNNLKKSSFRSALKNWHNKYCWEIFDKESGQLKIKNPSFYQILLAAYGTERNGRLAIDKDLFSKDQYRKFIVNLLENKSVPGNISKILKMNVRQRRRYGKSWRYMLQVALAVLSVGRKEDMNMRAVEKQTISYLYGRLLAIYENIERAAFDKGDERLTNAEKFWTAYTNKPAKIMMTLEKNVHPYAKKLLASEEKRGILYKNNKEKEEIINLIEEFEEIEKNKPLDYDFIFGYNAEKKKLFTKKEEI